MNAKHACKHCGRFFDVRGLPMHEVKCASEPHSTKKNGAQSLNDSSSWRTVEELMDEIKFTEQRYADLKAELRQRLDALGLAQRDTNAVGAVGRIERDIQRDPEHA